MNSNKYVMKNKNRSRLFMVLALLAFLCTYYSAVAQIKIVGDDYSQTLTGAKNYYDKDLSFDSLFPKVDLKEKYKVLYAWVKDAKPSETYYNNCIIGDTFFIPKDVPLKEWGLKYFGNTPTGTELKGQSLSFVVNHDLAGDNVLDYVPKGYYVVTGYVFFNGGSLRKKYLCEEAVFPKRNIEHLEYSYDGQFYSDERRLKDAKECLLTNEQKVAKNGMIECFFYDYMILKSIDDKQLDGDEQMDDDTQLDFYCYGFREQRSNVLSGKARNSGGFFKMLNVEFYNEFQKHFVGKNVLISLPQIGEKDCTDILDYKNFKREFINSGYVFTDALTNEKLKILDSIFVVKDVVLKVTDDNSRNFVYCILEGEHTGSFSINIDYLKYSTNVFDYYRLHCLSEITHLDKPIAISASDNLSYSLFALYTTDDYKYIKQQASKVIKQREDYKKQQQIEADNARKRHLQQLEQEKISFKQRMIEKYGEKYGTLVGQRQISVEMTIDMVDDAWGYPMNKYRTTTKHGQSEVWCYNYKTRVYFFEGKVVQIDD